MGKAKGKLVRWIDKRGFGFIKPDKGKDDIFIHISALKGRRRKPRVGDVIHYEISVDANDKSRAINASIEGVEQNFESQKYKGKKDHSTPFKNRIFSTATNNNKRSGNYKLLILLIIIAIAIGVAVNVFQEEGVKLIPADEEQAAEVNGSPLLTSAYENQQSDLQVGGTGIVIHVLSDDTSGSQHQRFILKLPSGQSLLVAHNIDLAPRIDSLRVGDEVEFYGEYEWNSKGGVLHWTHHDPGGSHENGWLKHNGSVYQ